MNTRHRLPNPAHPNGFTLIEVLIAVLVISVGLLGLAGLQGVSLKMDQGATLRVQATNLAYEIADAMRVNRNNASNYDTDTTAPTGSIAATDRAGWATRLANLLPSGTGTIDVVTTTGIRATITVTWDESRLGGSSSQSFSFTTEL